MPAPVSTLSFFIPRPQIPLPSSIPRLSTPGTPSSLPRTPNRSPVASHIFLSTPPAPNRNSTDSWNSSNYDLDDPNAEWTDEEVRLLVRTLDALPAHLITPFNGSVPPSNLLDKIARGIIAAKGPNDWAHSVRATRIKLLELARVKPQENRMYRCLMPGSSKSHCIAEEQGESDGAWQEKGCDGQKSSGTPDPADVLQQRTNAPIQLRRPLYRQSSMDFLAPTEPDRGESIARLSHRLQRHERTLHHPYLRPAHLRRRSESTNGHGLSPSTPSSSTLNSSSIIHSGFRKSTASATSASSSFGSPMSTSAPLRPSSLRRASTITLASTKDVQVDHDVVAREETEPGGGLEVGHATKGGVKVKRAPLYTGEKSKSPSPVILASGPVGKPSKKPRPTGISTSAATKCKSTTPFASKLKSPDPSFARATTPPGIPKTPPMESRSLVTEKVTPPRSSADTKKYRKGHKPQLSVSSDEEDNTRSKKAKKARTREPSWSALCATPAPPTSEVLASAHIGHPKRREGSESGRSTSTGRGSKTSASSRESTDNDLSTSSTSTAATSVSLSLPKSTHNLSRSKPSLRVYTKPHHNPVTETQKTWTVRRTLARNPSMFGAELPCPQPTPASPSRIPVSSPRTPSSLSPLSPALEPSTPPLVHTPLLSPVNSRPRTLRRAARRISFGSLALSGGSLNSIGNGQNEEGLGGTLGLGSAFQLA